MKRPNILAMPLLIPLLLFLLSLLFAPSYSHWGWFPPPKNNDNNPFTFIRCLSYKIYPQTLLSSLLYTPNNPSFQPLLSSTAQNLRYLQSSAAKPTLIFTPLDPSHVQAAVLCARWNAIKLRVRSGGHDYEGLSYATLSYPFVVLDLQRLRTVVVNPDDRTAWAMAGATNGELYAKIAQQSPTLAFPAGVCDSLGIGGHITGGAYGAMMRKYGLGADNAIDAVLVDANGNLLDRRSMGEDVFWSLRGGAGGSFGIILYWKLKLVPVPQNVTVFTVSKTLEQGATDLVVKWQQAASGLDDEVFIRLIMFPMRPENGKPTVMVQFNALYLGSPAALLGLMSRGFPELGLARADCIETSWIDSVLYIGGYPRGVSPAVLLEGKSTFKNDFKAKSDFLKEPVPKEALLKLWDIFMQDDAAPLMIWNPFGGEVSRKGEADIAFPHRDVIGMIQYVANWVDSSPAAANRHLQWMKRLYSFMTPYVSKNPRSAYVNYRDLDLGTNANGKTDYWTARMGWGAQYFGRNFDRLVWAKTRIDPMNFFSHEQSIPVLPRW